VSIVADHLVVAAATLEEGVAWCEATLGITPGPGGEHPLMGTHNRLFNISSERFPRCFFEIIAINPAVAAPQRKRWFGLDTLDLRAGPRLIHLVARSDTLQAHRAALLQAGVDPGVAVAASRLTASGLLQWQILVRDDGQLQCRGAMPTLVQWQGAETAHPAAGLPASGVALQSITLRGLPAAVRQALPLHAVEVPGTAGPAVTALLNTPRGPISLQSP
jgi:Glyoxalase-like domain